MKTGSENKIIPFFLNGTSRGAKGTVLRPTFFKIIIQVSEDLRAGLPHFIPSQTIMKC